MFEDTIAAIATANAMGAVSVIRVSGDEAISIVSKIMHKDLSEKEGYTITYGYIYEEDVQVDEVLACIFKAPKSFTGEDIVEINCHGGVYITRKVLSIVLGAGARLARPGEFTQRAFLHGKMDLSQAEGINDLIFARDKVQARSALHSLKGSVAKVLEPLEEDLTQILANIEVNIDYPEYDDVEQLTNETVLPKVRQWVKDITRLIETAESANLIKEGIHTVIAGKPNVGKSSLLNALLEEDKAIVTDIAGTTRDIVEGDVRVGDITLHLLDTAGIHESDNQIEKIGIQKSIDALEKAQLVILVLDSTTGIQEEDRELLERTKDLPRIIVYNKMDEIQVDNAVCISAREGKIEDLVKAIEEYFAKNLMDAQMDTLNNERQIGLARSAKRYVSEAMEELEAGAELDLVTVELQQAWNALKEITGKVGKEDLLDEIFSRFCLGK